MKNEIEQRLSEDLHYQIIPQEGTNGWDVRLLEEYPETVIRYGNVSFNGKDDCLNFSMQIVSSPDPDLTLDDLTFTEFCGRILSSIITDSLDDGSMVARDENTGEVMGDTETFETMKEMYDEYQSGTDYTEELTDE